MGINQRTPAVSLPRHSMWSHQPHAPTPSETTPFDSTPSVSHSETTGTSPWRLVACACVHEAVANR
eukprot:947609-Rhodomonas_salina.2